MHILRRSHTMPMLRQFSQPGALGLTGLMASRWVQRPGWSGSNLISIVVLIRAVTVAPPRTDGTEGWPSFASRDCGVPGKLRPAGPSTTTAGCDVVRRGCVILGA